MRLMYTCEIYNEKFDTNSYCKKWEADNYTKEHAGEGWSTKMKCENCQHMPERREVMDRLDKALSYLVG